MGTIVKQHRSGPPPDDTPQHALLTITPQLAECWLSTTRTVGSRRY